MDWKTTGEAVRQAREALGLTQKEAADRAGVSLPVWNALENGRQSSYKPRTLRAVARLLGWPTNWPSSPVPSGSGRPTQADTPPDVEATVEQDQEAWARIATAIQDLAGQLDEYVAGLHRKMFGLTLEVERLEKRAAALSPEASTAGQPRAARSAPHPGELSQREIEESPVVGQFGASR